MSFPDFTTFGYRVEQQLVEQSSSFTWQAISVETNVKVVIRELRFGSNDVSWQAYETQEQEIALLQQLEHPRIPQYLASFETETSFCLVREYLEGESLTKRSPKTEAEIVAIAVEVLEILRYLQKQKPSVLHLNLNPNNILRDEQNKIYLIGFDLVQNTNQSPQSSAIALNNAEFIAPEQLNTPCPATDIYGLGTTLQKIILLEPSLDITEFDEGLQDWLTKASNSDLKARYADAETALIALQASSWEEIAVSSSTDDQGSLSNKAYALGVGSLGVLGIAIAVGYQVSLNSEKSLIQMVVAVMAMIIVYLTQAAAATVITNDRSEQKQATIFAVGIPLSLVVITGFIWGKGEAVEVSLATAIAQAATLLTVLYSRLAQSPESSVGKLLGGGITIGLGLICGRLIF